MKKRVPLLYLDTSVFGGCFDVEFEQESNILIAQIKDNLFDLVIAETLIRELALAPPEVRGVLIGLQERVVVIEMSPQIVELRDAYLAANILPLDCMGDAEHIASATVAEADIIVSWNFKHIVNFRRIKAFQGINLQLGYKPVDIFSPREVIYETA